MTGIARPDWTAAPGGDAEMRDYFALMKPRVMALVIFTAAVGLLVAPVGVHPVIAFATVLCIAVGAGASGALNMWWDADIDAVMARTARRPVPSGRVSGEEALGLGLGLSLLSVLMLFLFGNALSAGLLAFTIFFYAVVYTMWLKRLTPQNIVIGGAAGAFPPMIGWAVATGGVSVESVLMFGVIFLWTPPHFWALALFMNSDYERAGVPMMTVVAGRRETRRQILVYSVLLAATGIAVAASSIGGPLTAAAAIVLNARLLRDALALRARDETVAGADGYAAEKRFFAFSILYLFAQFLALLADAVLRASDLLAAWPALI